MNAITRLCIYFSMSILTVVSIATTYISLKDSILPEPVLPIRLSSSFVWECALLAFGLSLAIDLLLYALKVSVIEGQKRLNLLGFLGMTILASVSIVFNIDVLYRTADRQFYMEYSTDKVKDQYATYFATVQTALIEKRTAILRDVARQEGELESEIKGLRKAPEGYGTLAKQEDYQLTVMKKEAEVNLKPVEDAIATRAEADTILATSNPTTIDEVYQLQSQLRVIAQSIGAVSGVSLPHPVKLDNPLFMVFEKLADWRSIGMKEIILILIAFLIDLGDIVGYVLIPNKKPESKRANEDELPSNFRVLPDLPGPRPVEPRDPALAESSTGEMVPAAAAVNESGPVTVLPPDSEQYEPRPRRSLRFRR
jgi:hypothetical protein